MSSNVGYSWIDVDKRIHLRMLHFQKNKKVRGDQAVDYLLERFRREKD